MDRDLEKFIHNNRGAFDDHEPSPEIWKRLDGKLDKKKAGARVVAFHWKRWAVAAAVLIIAGALFLTRTQRTAMPDRSIARQSDTGSTDVPVAHSGDTGKAIENKPGQEDETTPDVQAPDQRDLKGPSEKKQASPPVNTAQEELFHYARLIEIKQQQITTLKQKSPELYQQFASDLKKLEQSYTGLKKQLDAGLNSEQLLEAMILNLKMQTELLNKQLDITRKLNHDDDDKENHYNNL